MTVRQATPPALAGDYRPDAWAVHTPYSDPGRFGALIDAVPAGDQAASEVARNLVVHYRSQDIQLPAAGRGEIDARWVEEILALDQQRHPTELRAEREATSRVQGCCRDHSLIAAAVLRQHQVPARIRYGFVDYFVEGFRVDHVIVETWLAEENRWRRFDPEIESPLPRLEEPRDIPAGTGTPFETAAEAWRAYRDGVVDPDLYGVGSESPIRGPWYILNAVILDAALRAGREVLLWDTWQPMSDPGGPSTAQSERVDQLAAMIVAADAGDADTEAELIDRMRNDPLLRVPRVVDTMSPWGDPPRRSDLHRPVRDESGIETVDNRAR